MEELYGSKFSKGVGRPAKSVRLALGAMIVKHKLSLSDEEVVEQIRENPYLQYFVGFEEFRTELPFDSSLMTLFRKRFRLEEIFDISDLVEDNVKVLVGDGEEDGDDGPEDGDGSGNSGKLIVDATVAPADIKYPTDLGLLNEAREEAESLVDKLWVRSGRRGRKPRTYPQKGRKAFLAVAKKRRPGKRALRRGIKTQLGLLRRDLEHIDRLLHLAELTEREQERLAVLRLLFQQQEEMFREGKHRVQDRIVSIHQPHVRPIVRGKASAPVEFGAKLSVSLVDGVARIHRLSWNAFNEAGDLRGQVEEFRRKFGHYPASVHADAIYGTRENRTLLRELGIRFSVKPLGRPPKETPGNAAELAEKRRRRRRDELDRIAIEGKFGQGKRKYALNRIMAKLQNTSEVWIAMIFLVMNLDKWCEVFLSLSHALFSRRAPAVMVGMPGKKTIWRWLFFRQIAERRLFQ